MGGIIAYIKGELDRHGTLRNTSLRSDNSSIPLVAVHLSQAGINISAVHFSEAQDGKGPCDRKACSIKAHVLRYINEGNNVSNAAELKADIQSNGGVMKDCQVYLCEAPINAKLEKGKLGIITAFK